MTLTVHHSINVQPIEISQGIFLQWSKVVTHEMTVYCRAKGNIIKDKAFQIVTDDFAPASVSQILVIVDDPFVAGRIVRAVVPEVRYPVRKTAGRIVQMMKETLTPDSQIQDHIVQPLQPVAGRRFQGFKINQTFQNEVRHEFFHF